MLLLQFVGDAFVGEADELGERRVRTTGTAYKGFDESGSAADMGIEAEVAGCAGMRLLIADHGWRSRSADRPPGPCGRQDSAPTVGFEKGLTKLKNAMAKYLGFKKLYDSA